MTDLEVIELLTRVYEEARKPYATGDSIRKILGIDPSPINFYGVADSVYGDDFSNIELGEN
jgi:hypothetical protein